MKECPKCGAGMRECNGGYICTNCNLFISEYLYATTIRVYKALENMRKSNKPK